jgi:hypothetical protein
MLFLSPCSLRQSEIFDAHSQGSGSAMLEQVLKISSEVLSLAGSSPMMFFAIIVKPGWESFMSLICWGDFS